MPGHKGIAPDPTQTGSIESIAHGFPVDIRGSREIIIGVMEYSQIHINHSTFETGERLSQQSILTATQDACPICFVDRREEGSQAPRLVKAET